MTSAKTDLLKDSPVHRIGTDHSILGLRYHLSLDRQYKLIKEFCLIKDNYIYIYQDQKTNDLFVSTNKSIEETNNQQLVLMTAYNTNASSIMQKISIRIDHAVAVNVNWNLLTVGQMMRTSKKISSSRRKLWLYLLKLLPSNITNLYRMGVPTALMSSALLCASIAEVKEKVLGMTNMHPKLMAMPPTWRNIASYANAHFDNDFITALKPLEILKMVKLHRNSSILVDNVRDDIVAGVISAKDLLNSVKYLNYTSYSPKMYSVVNSAFMTIGLGYYFQRPKRANYLTYKYLYTFIRRKGSAKCTASYDLLLQYQ